MANFWDNLKKFYTTGINVNGSNVKATTNPIEGFSNLQKIAKASERLSTPKTKLDSIVDNYESKLKQAKYGQATERKQAAQNVYNQKTNDPISSMVKTFSIIKNLASAPTSYDSQVNDLSQKTKDARVQQAEARDRITLDDYGKSRANADFTSVAQKGVDESAFGKDAVIAGKSNGVVSNVLFGDLGLGKYNYMTPEERDTYFYVKQRNGQQNADKYLEALDLNARFGSELSDVAKENPFLSTVGSMVAGNEAYSTGAAGTIKRALGFEEPVEQLAVEKMHEEMAPQLTGAQKVLSDVGYTVGNILPSVAVGIATGGAGAAPALANLAGSGAMALGLFGQDYAQERRKGASDEEALTYSAINTALETGLQYILGGIKGVSAGTLSKVFGNTFKNVAGKLAKSPAAVQFITKTLAQGSGEALEEGIQAAIDPYIRNFTMNETNSADMENVLYSALLGFMTAGAMNAPSNVGEIRNNLPTTNERANVLPENQTIENLPDQSGVFVDYNPGSRSGGTKQTNTRLSDMGLNPESIITVYRGVPKGAQSKIVDGDWVTPSKQLAKDYAGNQDVISMQVKVKDLLADSDIDISDISTEEFIYSKSNKPQDIVPPETPNTTDSVLSPQWTTSDTQTTSGVIAPVTQNNAVNPTVAENNIKERENKFNARVSENFDETAQDIIRGTHKVATDEAALSDAKQFIDLYPDEAETRAKAHESKVDTVIGLLLLDKYTREGNIPKVKEITDAINSVTEGQIIQALSMYPVDTVAGAMRRAQSKIKEYNAKHPNKKIELNESDIKGVVSDVDKIQAMPDGDERLLEVRKLEEKIDALIPSPVADKVIAVWKAGLLSSLRTSERNVLGTAMHAASEKAKDPIAVFIDKLLSIKTGKRTKTATMRGVGKGIKKGVKNAGVIFKTGVNPISAESKLEVKKVNWGPSKGEQILKKYTDFVFNSMEAQDQPFYWAAYENSLYDQAGAIAINEGMARSVDEIAQNPTTEMKAIATRDAMYATFKDKTLLGKIIGGAKRAVHDKSPAAAAVLEIVAPFTQVPSSIAMKMIDYSPIGGVKGLVDFVKVWNDHKNYGDLQRQVGHEIGRGVIGTGILTLGFYLMSKGLITGQPKDDKERKQWEIEGKPANSINIFGKWYSINSVGPELLLLLAGSKFAQDAPFQEKIAGIAKDFMSQTFLQGVQGPLNAISDPKRYAQTYLSQQASSVIPNIVKDFAKAMDSVKRETSGDDIGTATMNAIKSGIPGLRNALLPDRDVLGREIQQQPTGIAAFFDLFNSKKPNQDAVTSEMQRLYDAGYPATPSEISKNKTVNGEKITLTQNQLDEFEGEAGRVAVEAIASRIQRPDYQNLTDEQKSDLLSDIISAARGATSVNIDGEEKITNSLSPVEKLIIAGAELGTMPIMISEDGKVSLDPNGDGQIKIDNKIAYNQKLSELGITTKDSSETTYSPTASADYSNIPNSPSIQGAGKINLNSGEYSVTADTLEKLNALGMNPQDYYYIKDRISAYDKKDKPAYLASLGLTGENLLAAVEEFVMSSKELAKMQLAIDQGANKAEYITAYLSGALGGSGGGNSSKKSTGVKLTIPNIKAYTLPTTKEYRKPPKLSMPSQKSIKNASYEQEIAAIQNAPFYTAKQKAGMIKRLKERYQ